MGYGCRIYGVGSHRLERFENLSQGQAATALAATTQHAEPQVLKRITELPPASVIAGHRVVLTPATKDALPPRANLYEVVVKLP